MIKSYCNSALKSRVRCAARVRHTDGEAENRMETDETVKKVLVPAGFCAQNVPGGLCCCTDDAENGYPFAYISDRFLEILGWERAEFAARFDNRYNPLLLQCLLNVQGELKQEILQW